MFRYNNTMSRYQFKPNTIPSLTTLVLITLFLMLSQWQWDKAESRRENENRMAEFKATAEANPLTLSNIEIAFQEWGVAISDAPVTLKGEFLQDVLIIWDNRIYNRQAGYHLIGLLKNPTSEALLPINLGWHALINARREAFPELELPKGIVTISGHLFVPHANRLVLGHTQPQLLRANATNTNPLEGHKQTTILTQRFDASTLSSMLSIEIAPYTIRVDTLYPQPNHHKKLIRIWSKRKNIGISAAKHQGYALQWLCFAVILLALFVGLNIKRTVNISH